MAASLSSPVTHVSGARLSKRALSAQVTRERILTAAHQLFVSQGFAATTIRQIAARAEVSVGSVMAIGDKAGLLVLIFDQLIALNHDDDLAQIARKEKMDRAEQLIAVVSPFIDLFAAHMDLARTYAAILVSGAHSSTVFTELRERLIDEISTVLGDADPHAARAIYYTYIGALFAWAATVPAAPPAVLYDELRAVFPEKISQAQGS